MESLLQNTKRILTTDYIPSIEDIIQMRATTKGVYETIFSFRNFTIRYVRIMVSMQIIILYHSTIVI